MARCDLCYDLRKKDVDDPRLAAEMTAEQLLNVEKISSCDICSFIVEGIRHFEDASWSLKRDVSRVYVYALSSRGDSLTVELYFRTDRSKLVLEFYHTNDQKPCWEAIRRRSPVTGFPVLSNGVRWVKSILEECRCQHPSCAIIQEPLLPKRTLYLERLNNGDICVKLRKHKNERDRYIALSHCWGSSPACTTTSKNIKAYQQSVPWEALPTTFRDAIIFTLELEVHHLWVDSLCIIQENAKDWEVESSRMADVYQNAYLTLAATAASNGSEGCFSVKRKSVKEVQLHLKNGDCSIMVREKVKHWRARSTNVSMQPFPLLTRGWVLQERYLSPRTLHFCLQELVWECLGDLTCECGGILADCDPLERLHLVADITEPINPQHNQPIIDKKNHAYDQAVDGQNLDVDVPVWNHAGLENDYIAEGKFHVSDQWHSIVEQYTSLKLSKETDRLPALSGLAMRASSILGTYSCGLWLNTITNDLLWRVPLLEHGYGRPTKFTGPSWSWASVNGPVAYWNDLDDEHDDDEIDRLRYNTQTLGTWLERNEAKQALQRRLQERAARRRAPDLQAECDITLAGENPFGEVNSGRLRITGFIRGAKLLYVNQYGSAKSTIADRHDPLRYRLCIQATSSPFWNKRSLDLELPFFADHILSDGPEAVLEGDLITLLQIRYNIGLVLRLTGIKGEYRRIGIARQSSGYLTLYGLNWMSGSSQHVLTIV
ncbi:HET-domain-containing protein [Cenococcum geophilum]